MLGSALVVGLAATPAWAAAPDAPSAPTAVAGNAQITVTFTAPANNGGKPITNYTASCTSSNGGTSGIGATQDGNVAPITVPGLTNLDTYTCTVTATNADGTSAPSLASAAVEPAAPPDAPPQPTADAGDTQIVVRFTAPNNNGSPITSYTVACISTDGGPLGSASGTSSPISVTVANAHTYFCHVTATNSGGVGPASPDTPNVFPAGVPDAPTQPTLARGNRLLVVTFDTPASNGAPIAGYTATCTSSDSGASGVQAGAGSPITVAGLTNAKTYTCNVTATNMVGTSPPSPDSDSAIPVAVPNAPGKPSAARGVSKIVVGFSTPNNNGFPITGYTVTCTSSNGGVTGTHTGTSSPITVTGLTNDKSYTCRAWASNSLGTSPRSAASDPAVPGVPPGAPTILSVSSGPAPGTTGPLTVAFKPGPTNGSPVTGYRVACARVTTGATVVKTTAKSPAVLTGLVVGNAYSCTAVAMVAGGVGATSSATRAVVGTPGAATVVRAKRASPTTAKVTFTAAPSNGAPVARYTVTCRSSNGGTAKAASAAVTTISVPGLTSGKTYTCSVVATNHRGAGPTSGPSPPVTLFK